MKSLDWKLIVSTIQMVNDNKDITFILYNHEQIIINQANDDKK